MKEARNWTRADKYDVVIETDASLTGLGGNLAGKTVRGNWTSEDRKSHINVLELRAIEYVLLQF